jgi:hypothetical protein
MLVQYLIQETLENEEVSMNLCLKYPEGHEEMPRLTLSTSLLLMSGLKISWAEVEGRLIFDNIKELEESV